MSCEKSSTKSSEKRGNGFRWGQKRKKKAEKNNQHKEC